MKKGKTSKILGFNNAKILYGTINSLELKSIYIIVQTWVEPKDEYENWQRIVLNLSREIKHIVHNNLDRLFFKNNFIVDLDLRPSGIYYGKRSFVNLDINLYLNPLQIDFKSIRLRESIKKIVNNIFDSYFNNCQYFTFHLTKADKIVND